MPDSTFVTTEQAFNQADVLKDALALSKLRFFDETLTVDVNTTKAMMVAAETTLTGYPAGGYTLTAFLGPSLSALGGAIITTPITEVAWASGDAVTLGGAWIELAGGESWITFKFDPKRTFSTIYDVMEFVRQILQGRNT